jgi:ribose transport system substrate-binding protein
LTKFLRRTGLIAALVLSLGLAACGSGSGSGSGSASGSASGSGSGGDNASAQQALDTAYKGETGTPPTQSTTPKPGVNLWVVSCGEMIPSCATPTAAAKAAGEAAGWTVKVCDGQLNPDGWGSCVRQAVSAKADAVIPIGIDCASIQQPFQEAKTAGVTVIGGGGADCDETGGQALWATERIQLADYDTTKKIWELTGKLAADWLIGTSGGKAQILQTVFTDPVWGPWQAEGFTNEIATCSGCTIVATLELSNNDFISGSAAQKFSTALLQAPTADSVHVAIGGWMPQGFAQAIQSSGRSDQLNVISGLGDAANMDLIRNDGGQDAIVGYATPWGGWGSVDEAIRVLNGEQPVVEGDGLQVVDKDHNLPDSGDYTGGVDFQAAYKKAWGV